VRCLSFFPILFVSWLLPGFFCYRPALLRSCWFIPSLAVSCFLSCFFLFAHASRSEVCSSLVGILYRFMTPRLCPIHSAVPLDSRPPFRRRSLLPLFCSSLIQPYPLRTSWCFTFLSLGAWALPVFCRVKVSFHSPLSEPVMILRSPFSQISNHPRSPLFPSSLLFAVPRPAQCMRQVLPGSAETGHILLFYVGSFTFPFPLPPSSLHEYHRLVSRGRILTASASVLFSQLFSVAPLFPKRRTRTVRQALSSSYGLRSFVPTPPLKVS